MLPRAEIAGDMLHVRHFRNFSYTASGEPVPRYEERTYDLAKLSSLDYFLAHWSGPVIAHTLVSFGFDDGQFLCVSVEARRQRWQSYSPLWGLFRSYQLMFVLGDERDIVRLRTNIRREQVYMYRLRLPPQDLRRRLLDYVRRIEMLAAQPGWYNSVTSNCTTNLFYNRRANVPWWLKPNIFLNGLSARAMYRLGFLDNSLPYQELQARCAIRDRALAAGDAADFSQQIRRADCEAVAGNLCPHFINARFRQRFARLSVPPKSVVKRVESMSKISPARCSDGGSQSRQLNSLLPAAVKGCGRSGSISCRPRTCTDFASWVVTS